MSEDGGYDDEIRAEIAFKDHFPVEDFNAIAKSLGLSEHRHVLILRRLLLNRFYDFYRGISGKHRSRRERLRDLRAIRDASSALRGSLLNPNAAFDLLPLDFYLDTVSEEFLTILAQLTETAESHLAKLAETPTRRGRRANDEFRELTVRLVLLFEGLTKTTAYPPYWLPDKRAYGGRGKFADFAIAVWRCLKANVPEGAKGIIPATDDALMQELRRHWPKARIKGKELPVPATN
jgi:hypothetical protein